MFYKEETFYHGEKDDINLDGAEHIISLVRCREHFAIFDVNLLHCVIVVYNGNNIYNKQVAAEQLARKQLKTKKAPASKSK